MHYVLYENFLNIQPVLNKFKNLERLAYLSHTLQLSRRRKSQFRDRGVVMLWGTAPARVSCSITCFPRNPAPPVTSTAARKSRVKSLLEQRFQSF